MFKNIVCPISSDKVDSNVSRFTVFINAVLMIIFLITLQPIPLYLVTIDYGIRAFGYNNYSPICKLSTVIINSITSQTKMVDKAPKVFASRLGFICAVLGVVFISMGMTLASTIVIAMFTVLAILDSVFNFCVGCLIYHTLVFPFYKKDLS